MEFVRMILENIFSEDSVKYIKIFKANEIDDESIKLLTVEDFDALIPDDEDARDKIIASFAELLTTDSFTWPREPKKPMPVPVSKHKKSSAVQLSLHNGNSSSESERELLPKITKKDDGSDSSGGNNGNNGIQNRNVPLEILQKRIVDQKIQYLVKWAGKKKLLTWEWSFDEKLESYQYIIRHFEKEEEKEVVNGDCIIVDDEQPGPSGSCSKPKVQSSSINNQVQVRSSEKSKRKDNQDQVRSSEKSKRKCNQDQVRSSEKIDQDYNNYDFEDGGDTAYVVEAILNKRKDGRRWEFLIRWQGYPESDNSWEPRTSLDQCQEMLKAFEAKWKANNQNQTDRGNGNEKSNSRQSQS